MSRVIMVFLMIILLAGGFSHPQLKVKAAGSASAQATRYYTSICITDGESLWSIASKYKQNSPMTTLEYIEELKRMNSLKDELIHTGHYLIVVYFQ